MYVALDIIGINNPSEGHIIAQAVEDVFSTYLQDNNNTVFINVEIALDEFIESMHGLVDQEQEDEYTIYINNLLLDNGIELYRTVVHECVHIKQYLTKQLEHINLFCTFWEGIEYDSTKMDYRDLPWEVEAFAIEEEMAKCYSSNQK